MTEAMVIDTNVLEHAFNPLINGDGHVERLLRKFTKQKKKLCVDRSPGQQSSRIIREYHHRLQFHRRAMSDETNLLQWLRYILELAERVDTPVNLGDALGRSLAEHMDAVHAERSDQVFVYVACVLDSVMVSNNTHHVTDLRADLRGCAQATGSHQTDFLSSVQAEGAM